MNHGRDEGRRMISFTHFCYENLRRRRLRLECDAVAEAFEATHQVSRHAARVEPVEIARAQILVRGSRRKHVVGGDEDLVADCHGCALGAPAGAQAMELVAEVAALLAGSGDRRLDQGCPEVHVPLASAGGLPFPGTLVVPRTYARPGAATCLALGKTLMSVPSSARRTAARMWLTPGICSNSWRCSW